MKKKLPALPPFSLFTAFLTLCLPSPATAQIPEPADWERFVTSSANPVVRDTFRLQTFSEDPADNWTYATEGNTFRFDAAEAGIANQGGLYSQKMEPGSRLSFTPFPSGPYTDIQIHFRYAAKDLMKGENLLISAERAQNSLHDYAVCTVATGPYTLSYPAGYAKNHIQIGSNPTSLTLRVATAAATSGGFYCLDSVYAHGLAPRYSLFAGNGRWEETAGWSHGTPGRSRDALVKGSLHIGQFVSGRELALSGGSIEIAPGGRLKLQQLRIYASETSGSLSPAASSFFSAGETDLSGMLTILKTFSTVGEWHFISFPFDVYPDGIDNTFVWKDETPNPGGNYFYVCRYNSRRRAETQTPSGNWEVIRPGSLAPGRPLFEKNKGYLIALDAGCARRTLSFSSRPGDIPSHFARKGELSLEVSPSSAGDTPTAGAHTGWCLCGNPFPAPLSLSNLSADPSYEPFLYVYDGEKYQPYALGSDYTLPPYSAFFLKVKTGGVLTWTQPYASLSKQQQIPFPPALKARASEPVATGETPTAILPAVPGCAPRAEWTDRGLRLEGMPAAGVVRGFAPEGKLLYTLPFPAGSSLRQLPDIPAVVPFVILHLQAAGFQKSYKYRVISRR